MTDLDREVEELKAATEELEKDRERRVEIREELKTGPGTLRSRLADSLTKLRKASA